MKSNVLKISTVVIGFAASVVTIIGGPSNPSLAAGIFITVILVTYIAYRKASDTSIGGIVEFRQQRDSYRPEWWISFFDERKSPKEVFLMSQTLAKTFKHPKQAAAFLKWCKGHTRIRLLLLSPTDLQISQHAKVGYDIEEPSVVEDPIQNLPKKIVETLHLIDDKVLRHVDDTDKRPQIRYATRDLPFSLNCVDDDMIVTFYGTSAEADKQPTLLIKRRKGKAFEAFKEEFERIWGHFSKIYPYEDPVISEYRKSWSQYIGLRRYGTPAVPRQAIIIPTYACSEHCSYCMFHNEQQTSDGKEMSPDAFDKTLDEVLRYGIKYIEITGGGEPLEHSQVGSLLEVVRDKKQKYPNARFGLLTNGMQINGTASILLDTFDDYIRISRCEVAEKAPGFSRWRENVLSLIREKGRRNKAFPHIGVKYLLSPQNISRFKLLVEEHLRDDDLCSIDHWRFRSDRRVNSNTSAKIEQQVYHLLSSIGFPNTNTVVSLSMHKLYYPKNFKCWISPMHTVIDPERDVYLCCNFAHDKGKKRLGSLNRTTFQELWHSDRHKQLRKTVEKTHCARDDYSNCRYAELQNIFEEIALAAREIKIDIPHEIGLRVNGAADRD